MRTSSSSTALVDHPFLFCIAYSLKIFIAYKLCSPLFLDKT
ncbi:hypothetical protein HMPREF3187_01170 [Aerococcus christensenii]|uniref:Uncharacterized protein n=1 Tax=Aerococcus christensenii TaxID=87541 RepID=A0A133XXX3_9LACT|nr:hypothetical protein HMPREF3187_01170 [Aerococcus christensenii]